MEVAERVDKRPGDPCQCAGCAGRLRVYSTRINFVLQRRTRYLCCDACGDCPDGNKWVLPLEFAPVRATSSTN